MVEIDPATPIRQIGGWGEYYWTQDGKFFQFPGCGCSAYNQVMGACYGPHPTPEFNTVGDLLEKGGWEIQPFPTDKVWTP